MTKDQPPAAPLSFSLLDEPWLPVTTQHGDTRHVSLKDVFAHAHHLRGIEDDSPLVVAALHRLLLAVLHRATRLRSVEDWDTVWQAGRFAGQQLESIHSYLERYRDRFDLFSREKPFFQTAGFAAENGEPSPAADLFTD
ncbi:MAG: type I-E CRISPR-associated protein Cse1/CasA [Chloracidobacterium sp.]|nr:type I-E CRISPR-associated protein Cse1/CasA [Chloracidobacterium sp.]MDW8216645.1 type I-E CRISPR-associated protein Cse1/CasA [Acidobacteriota bacterium]